MSDKSQPRRILLTGSTGYVGGRLLRPLETAGYRVRCMARYPRRLDDRVGAETEVVAGDVLDAASLRPALKDIDTVFYLVNSMGDDSDFEAKERRAADNFVVEALRAGVRRIIYLGGLGRGAGLSAHLESRQEVGRILAASKTQTIELRTSVIIGSGSLSFELVRALVSYSPVMVMPAWARLQTTAISVEDVVAYLQAAIDVDIQGSRVFEIGAPDVVSYSDLMHEYAAQRGLRRLVIPVPLQVPWLSSLWLGLVTPLFARIGRKIIDSLRNETVLTDRGALDVFDINPRPPSDAIARAIHNEDQEIAETHWCDALSSKGSLRRYGGVRFGSRLVDSRSEVVDLPPADAFRPIERIGGQNGWYFASWLWDLRGFLDLLVGGVGRRRGRRNPTRLRTGDALDWWRVEKIEPDRLLRLVAEMKVPGRAWLQYEVHPDGDGGSRIYQTALFDPLGLPGLLYWYGIWPIHAVMFRGMIRSLVQEAKDIRAREG